MTKIKTGILLLATVLLTSCTTKLIYNHLDWAIEWYVDDLVTLNDDQEWKLRDALQSTLKWHRQNQLPFYIKSLDEVSQEVKSGLSHEFLKRFYFAHEKGWMELKYHITPVLTDLLKTLSDRQVKELGANMQEQEDELVEKYVNKPAQVLEEERTERMIDRLENWVGNLSKEQKQFVYTWSRSVEPVALQWAQSRQQWQTNFVNIVKNSRSTPEFNSLMMEHFQNSRKYWPEGYNNSYYHNVDLTLLLVADIARSLSADQKKKLLGKIESLKAQFIEILNEN